jgi:hypothetical protein
VNYAIAFEEPYATRPVGLYDGGRPTNASCKQLPDYEADANKAQAAFEAQFRFLVRHWLQDVMTLSSISEMVARPAYLAIIGFGPPAVPYLIAELERASNHWFAALEAITRTNPVRDEDRGNLTEMRQAWLDWADREGYA